MQQVWSLLSPLPLFLVLLLVASYGLGRSRWWGAWLFLIVLLALYGLSTKPGAEYLVASLENRHPAIASDSVATADAIVVAAGAAQPAFAPRAEPGLTALGDRLRKAQALHAAERAPTIVTLGGRPPRRPGAPTEAQAAASILRDWGVPADAIIARGEQGTLRDQVAVVRRVMALQDFDRIIFVGSALDLPRAAALLDKIGVAVTAVPADFRSRPEAPSHWSDLLPSAAHLERSQRAITEHLKLVYYRQKGWID